MDSYLEFVLDQLDSVPALNHRRMFGGFGLYSDTVFFGIVFDGRLYFHTTSQTQKRFEDEGMEVFRPNARQTLKAYYEVPPHVIEDRTLAAGWAFEAVAGVS